jgi:hypothetical protein
LFSTSKENHFLQYPPTKYQDIMKQKNGHGNIDGKWCIVPSWGMSNAAQRLPGNKEDRKEAWTNRKKYTLKTK